MQTKNTPPPELIQNQDLSPLLQAYFELCQLKQLYRQGWLQRGIPSLQAESIAEHSFGVAVLALWLLEADYPELDRLKVIQMALLHDFGEVYAGDLIPSDNVPAAEKSRREADSILRVFGKLAGGAKLQALWQEFEAGETPEARLVRQLDRLEMGLQASVYAAQGFTDLHEFWDSANKAVTDSPLSDLLAEVEQLHGKPRL